MLNDLVTRDDVRKFIKQLKFNDRYFDKELRGFADRKMTISNELALYIFYEALYKYQILFDNIYLFDEYLEQLDKLYKKIDNFDDIVIGINKLICRLLILELDIKDSEKPEEKEKLIKHVYYKYINRGYFIHGFNTSYTKEILEKGFDPENYENYYEKFIKLNEIFEKYKVSNIIEKDFSKKEVTFTDDFLMGCYYSIYGPNFYSSFLRDEDHFGRKQKQDGYLIDDYDLTISHLKRFMSNSSFSENDKKFVLDLVKDEWDLLHREDKKVSLLLVERSFFKEDKTSIDEYLNSDEDIYDIVDRILSPKKTRIECKKMIPAEELIIINLDAYYDEEAKIDYRDQHKEELAQYQKEQENKEFMDTYGNVSALLIVGSLLITLGVIMTIIMLIRGI